MYPQLAKRKLTPDMEKTLQGIFSRTPRQSEPLPQEEPMWVQNVKRALRGEPIDMSNDPISQRMQSSAQGIMNKVPSWLQQGIDIGINTPGIIPMAGMMNKLPIVTGAERVGGIPYKIAKPTLKAASSSAGYKEPWQQTIKEYLATYEDIPVNHPSRSALITDSKVNHKAFVERAIREGESVPSEVLKDYPDLAKIRPTITKRMPQKVSPNTSMTRELWDTLGWTERAKYANSKGLDGNLGHFDSTKVPETLQKKLFGGK